jgi:hypothetical protein
MRVSAFRHQMSGVRIPRERAIYPVCSSGMRWKRVPVGGKIDQKDIKKPNPTQRGCECTGGLHPTVERRSG